MKQIMGYLLVSFFLLVQTAVASQDDQLAKKISQLVQPFSKSATLAIQIQSMRTGKMLYRKNADKLFSPASVQKLFTSVFALDYLGQNYRFSTKLLSKGKVNGFGVLNSDLILKFSGDPSFSYADLEQMFNQLYLQGVHRLSGNLLVDDSAYEPAHLGPGWMWDDDIYCYSSPVGAAILDHNCLMVTLFPTNETKLAYLKPTGLTVLTPLLNQVVTASSGTMCKVTAASSSNNHYQLQGCINKNKAEEHVKLSVKNMPLYMMQRLQQALAASHITLGGRILFETMTDGTEYRLVNHYSQPLWQLVSTVLKKSDNLYAEAVLKRLAAEYFKEPGSWELGRQVLRALIEEKLKVKLKEENFVDGSGLSRYNFVTAKILSKLLYYTYHNARLAPEILASLPVAGEDAALTKIMHVPKLHGLLRAKTGSMLGVNTLAGFVQSKRYGDLSFVILVNGITQQQSQYRLLQKKIVSLLAA